MSGGEYSGGGSDRGESAAANKSAGRPSRAGGQRERLTRSPAAAHAGNGGGTDSAATTCANGGHDFMEPVVVATEEASTFLWFMSRDTVSRECAVVFCRRCGQQTMAGWTARVER